MLSTHLDNPIDRREIKSPSSNISRQQNRPWSPHEVKVDLSPPRMLALSMQGHNWHAWLQGAQELEREPDLRAQKTSKIILRVSATAGYRTPRDSGGKHTRVCWPLEQTIVAQRVAAYQSRAATP